MPIDKGIGYGANSEWAGVEGSTRRRGAPYTPGQYPVADLLLGEGLMPDSPINIAKVDPNLLSAGAARIWAALKTLKGKKWRKILDFVEGEGTLPEVAANSLERLNKFGREPITKKEFGVLDRAVQKTPPPKSQTMSYIKGGVEPKSVWDDMLKSEVDYTAMKNAAKRYDEFRMGKALDPTEKFTDTGTKLKAVSGEKLISGKSSAPLSEIEGGLQYKPLGAKFKKEPTKEVKDLINKYDSGDIDLTELGSGLNRFDTDAHGLQGPLEDAFSVLEEEYMRDFGLSWDEKKQQLVDAAGELFGERAFDPQTHDDYMALYNEFANQVLKKFKGGN